MEICENKKVPLDFCGTCANYFWLCYIAPDFRSTRMRDAGEHVHIFALLLNALNDAADVLGVDVLGANRLAIVTLDGVVAVIDVVVNGDVHGVPFVGVF